MYVILIVLEVQTEIPLRKHEMMYQVILGSTFIIENTSLQHFQTPSGKLVRERGQEGQDEHGSREAFVS